MLQTMNKKLMKHLGQHIKGGNSVIECRDFEKILRSRKSILDVEFEGLTEEYKRIINGNSQMDE